MFCFFHSSDVNVSSSSSNNRPSRPCQTNIQILPMGDQWYNQSLILYTSFPGLQGVAASGFRKIRAHEGVLA